MLYFYLLAIFALGSELYNLVPETAPTTDAGLLLIFTGMSALLLTRNTNFKNCLNMFGFFAFAYLLLVASQAAVAAMYYQQPIIDGLIAARKQFYFLSYFLFATLLYERNRIHTFLDALSLLALGLIFLGLVNYFVHPILYHKWAEGQGMRGGMVRGFIPGMPVVALACLWQSYKLLRASTISYLQLMYASTLFAGILFRQTRAYIIVVLGTVALMLFMQRRWAPLVLGAITLVMGTVVLSLYTQENLIVSSLTTAYSDLTTGGGTWGARLVQIRRSSAQLAQTFWTGSGGVTIRADEGWQALGNLRSVGRNMDLGYFVWLKFFGLPGLILLLVLYATYAYYVIRVRHLVPAANQTAFGFAGYYFLAIMGLMVTLPYFTQPDGALVVCTAMAIFTATSTQRAGAAVQPG